MFIRPFLHAVLLAHGTVKDSCLSSVLIIDDSLHERELQLPCLILGTSGMQHEGDLGRLSLLGLNFPMMLILQSQPKVCSSCSLAANRETSSGFSELRERKRLS